MIYCDSVKKNTDILEVSPNLNLNSKTITIITILYASMEYHISKN